MATATEFILGLYDGNRVAVKCWGDEHSRTKILALHGWLDNAATWDGLAPLIVGSKSHSIRIVAMDFLGHGDSSHPPQSSYLMAERVLEVVAVADALRWSTFVLMGHSMGASVASLVAGTIPNRIEKLILVESLGTYLERSGAAEQLEQAMKERPMLMQRQRRIYPSFDAALEKYLKNRPQIKRDSAKLLISRGTEEVLVHGVGEVVEKGVCFKHDPKLIGTSTMSYSEKSVLAFLKRITCPVFLIVASNPERANPNEHILRFRKIFVERMKQVQFLQLLTVPNTEHHLHLDHPEKIYKQILDFIDGKEVVPRANL